MPGKWLSMHSYTWHQFLYVSYCWCNVAINVASWQERQGVKIKIYGLMGDIHYKYKFYCLFIFYFLSLFIRCKGNICIINFIQKNNKITELLLIIETQETLKTTNNDKIDSKLRIIDNRTFKSSLHAMDSHIYYVDQALNITNFSFH